MRGKKPGVPDDVKDSLLGHAFAGATNDVVAYLRAHRGTVALKAEIEAGIDALVINPRDFPRPLDFFNAVAESRYDFSKYFAAKGPGNAYTLETIMCISAAVPH